MKQYPPTRNWQALALFSSRSVDPGLPIRYQSLVQSGQLRILYLNELEFVQDQPLEQQILEFVIVSEAEAKMRARGLQERIQRIEDVTSQRKILELIEKIAAYKFNTLSREEIEAMFTMDELKQTRYVQELIADERQEGELTLVLRQLTRRLRSLSTDSQAQLQRLTLIQIEELSLDLLDFSSEQDLRLWLEQHS